MTLTANVRTSKAPTLLIGGSLDGTTPAATATRELLPHLPNGHQVILKGFGHTDDFWQTQAAAGTHLITSYLDTGNVDASRFRPIRPDFTPGMSQQGIAKIIAAVLVAWAGVTLFAMATLPRRLARRGSLGRTAAVAVRTAGAAVFGLGGWCAGALLVLTAMPSVPIDAEGLAIAFIGTPVALATYWAWVVRDHSARDKATGLVVVAVGAIVGAWLGYGAADSPLALITAVLGACAGANFALVGRDMASEPTAPVIADGHGAPAPAPDPLAV